MNRELKVGDIVKIISREYVDSLPKKGQELKYHFTSYMRKYCGRIATIKKVGGEDLYILDIDHACYNWCSDMFEKSKSNLLRNE